MNFGQSDSSGTEDDYPSSNKTRGQRSCMNGNGRNIGGDLQNDMESQIRRLEQEAYCSVLRAFKAQSDAITWEKEGIITDLRKELLVSDEDHRRFLTKVNAEDTIRRIREWRQGGRIRSGLLNNSYSNHDAAASPSSSHKRPRPSQAMPSMSLGVPPALPPLAVTAPIQPSSSAAKQGKISGAKSKKPKPHPSVANRRDQVAHRGSSVVPTASRPWQQTSNESLIGQKVMTRWPADNNFYEAVITSYSAQEGLHSLVYDMNTANEAWEWVNLREIAPEDICWVRDEHNALDQVGQNGPNSGIRKSQQAGGVIGDAGRGKGTSADPPKKKNNILSRDGRKNRFEDIEILHTDTLLKEVERILAVSNQNPLEIEKAKKMLREHEQSLVDAIARLADISDGDSEDDGNQFSLRQAKDRGRAKTNHQRTANQPVANYNLEGQEGSDDEQTT